MQETLKRFLEQAAPYIGLKSISTDMAFQPDIQATVEWLTTQFKQNGFKVDILQGPTTNPVVVAHYHISDDVETILNYGHYDVQPASIEEGWNQDPFTLAIYEDRVEGRGVVDNKLQTFIHIFTAFELIKRGQLKYNLKFMIEGNEESGNQDMEKLIVEHADLLTSDYILISDGEIGAYPSIEMSLRGGGNFTLNFKTSNEDTHSGLFGGIMPNAAMELAIFLSKLKNPKNGRVLVPGFYDGVIPVSAEILQTNKTLAESIDILPLTGTKVLIGEHDRLTQNGFMPTLEITGYNTGYTGEGYRNAIPGKAFAKINLRTVVPQDPQAVFNSIRAYAEEQIPEYVEWMITDDSVYQGVRVNTDTPMVQHIMALQEEIYGVKPILTACGAGIPIVTSFQTLFGADALLVSLGNDTCRMHGVNENYELIYLERGLQLSERLLSK